MPRAAGFGVFVINDVGVWSMGCYRETMVPLFGMRFLYCARLAMCNLSPNQKICRAFYIARSFIFFFVNPRPGGHHKLTDIFIPRNMWQFIIRDNNNDIEMKLKKKWHEFPKNIGRAKKWNDVRDPKAIVAFRYIFNICLLSLMHIHIETYIYYDNITKHTNNLSET